MARRKRPPPSAVAKAVDLLSRRDHSRAELRRKLRQREYPSDAIEQALDRLEELGLHDEQKSCRHMARSFAEFRGYGPIKIRGRLREKGFSSMDIDDAMDHLEVDWHELCRNVAEKRAHKGRAAVLRFLASRGFPSSIARRAAEEVAEWDP